LRGGKTARSYRRPRNSGCAGYVPHENRRSGRRVRPAASHTNKDGNTPYEMPVKFNDASLDRSARARAAISIWIRLLSIQLSMSDRLADSLRNAERPNSTKPPERARLRSLPVAVLAARRELSTATWSSASRFTNAARRVFSPQDSCFFFERYPGASLLFQTQNIPPTRPKITPWSFVANIQSVVSLVQDRRFFVRGLMTALAYLFVVFESHARSSRTSHPIALGRTT